MRVSAGSPSRIVQGLELTARWRPSSLPRYTRVTFLMSRRRSVRRASGFGLRAGADPLLRRQGGESSRAREPSERLRETRAADLARAPDTQLKAQENEGEGKLGAGGMADTRDPEPFVNDSDKRQSISQAPSFEVRDDVTRIVASLSSHHAGIPQAALNVNACARHTRGESGATSARIFVAWRWGPLAGA